MLFVAPVSDPFPESVKGSGEYLEDRDQEILQLDSYNAQIVTIKAVQELIKDNEVQKEIIEDQKCGYVVDPQPKAIAHALHDYFTNNREDEMVEGVKEAKVKFSWDKLTKTIYDLCT